MNNINGTFSTVSGSEILLTAASPDLYRINAFRISGLPIDATTRDISKQVERIEISKKYGRNLQDVSGCLSPDEDTIREAMQRLRDPERRMVDELFWFWPHQLGQSKNDEALKALNSNNIKKANELWIKQESMSSNANISMHNLAVLSHLEALDLEHKSVSEALSEKEIEKRDHHWNESFKRWKVLLEHEEFWSRFTGRIRHLDDPRLTTGTSRRIRESLPIALLHINAELAVKAAESKNINEAKRHITVISKSGFDDEHINEALRRAVKPIRKRINTLCKATSNGDIQPENEYKIATQLISQAERLISILDIMLPNGHPIRDGAHDEVALTALLSLISFANKTENWKKVDNQMRTVLDIAVSKSACERIQENMDIFKKNIAYDLEYKTCFFCKGEADQLLPKKTKCLFCDEDLKLNKEERDSKIYTCSSCNKVNDLTDQLVDCKDEDAEEVKMCGNVYNDGYRITWKHNTIKIPRCEACKRAHDRIDSYAGIGGLFGVLLGFGGCYSITQVDDDIWFIGLIVWVVIIASFAGLGYLIARSKIQKIIKPNSHKTNFSRVKELLAEGWGFGDTPPEANQ